MAQEFTAANFKSEVIDSALPVLVDFWAEWCGPCRMLGPVVEELSVALAGKVRVGKVNVDQEAEISRRYEITSIPTLLIFKGGQVVDMVIGAVPREHIIAKLAPHLPTL